MASIVLRRCPRSFPSANIQRSLLSTTGIKFKKIEDFLKVKEPEQISELAVLKPEEYEQKKQLQGYIEIKGQENISSISGIPEEHIKTRTVRIYMPARNVMQSGTDNINFWQIEFDTRQRWENPLMGWCSSGDPHSNLKVEFSSKEDAIAYCEKNGWNWYLQEIADKYQSRPSNYGLNFSWNKRTRVSTK